jgi:hypothetical protein
MTPKGNGFLTPKALDSVATTTYGKVYEMALWVGDGLTDTSLMTTADKNAIIAYIQTKYNLSGMTLF